MLALKQNGCFELWVGGRSLSLIDANNKTMNPLDFSLR